MPPRYLGLSWCFRVKRETFSPPFSVEEEEVMISILAQERLLGAALGSILAGVVVFEQRKCIYKSIADNQSQLDAQLLKTEPIFGKQSRSEFAHIWNKTVDKTLGPVIAALSSRGW